jgi:Immunity protein 50
MRWYELAENPRAITELYSEVPLLQSIRLVEVLLLRDGPRMTIKTDLPRFPDKAPARWKLQGYNEIQLQLDFWGVQSLHIAHWSTEDQVEIQIRAAVEKRIDLTIVSSQYHITAMAHDFRIKIHKRSISM